MTDLSDDLVWGAEAIGAEINKGARATYYMLERKLIPAAKIGESWVASRRKLRAHFAALMDPNGIPRKGVL
jgi:hypothetical protein